MNTYRISYYQKRMDVFTETLKKVKKQHGLVSVIRLSSFLLLLISWFYIFTINTTIGAVLGSILVIVFFVLIKVHKRIEDKKKYLETIIDINEKEINCCNQDFSSFDDGKEYIESNHPYSYDIDLFGKGSLFQYINRTVTNNGKKLLANWLANTPLKNEQILKNQKAVIELSDKPEFRQDFRTIGKLYKSDEDEELLIKKWLTLTTFFKSKTFYSIILFILPLINLVVLGLIIFGYIYWSHIFSIIIVNLSLVGFRLKLFNTHYNLLNKSHTNLKKMTKLFNQVEKLTLTSELLKELQSHLFKNKNSASLQIDRLTKLLDALDNRNNILLGFLLNTFLLWDWNCLWRIEKWQKTHLLDYENWQKTIAHFDALISLANLSFNNPDFTYPELSKAEYEFNTSQIGHPLLPNNVRICNDFDINHQQRYAIVTGANMAGKSTFLRTIAVNLILAGCGSSVCANKFRFTPLPLHSSMRAEDSLMKNESYFFAELKRLQHITQALEKGEKLFIILDEILRGTNSEDKRKGSIGFVKKITEKMAHGLVATHDLELARLAEQQPETFKALCFEVGFKNNELQFDYKLQPGVTKNMNASFLMKRMGIID